MMEKWPAASAGAYEIDPILDPRWAELVHSHPQASVFHSQNWLRALRSTYRYEPRAFTTCPPGSPLTNGLVFCRIESWFTGRRFVSLPFSDHCEPLIGRPDELDRLLLPLRRGVDGKKCKYIEIRPISDMPAGSTGLGTGSAYFLHRLDLGPAAAELFRGFNKKSVQCRIRRAERERLQYSEGTTEELLQTFYRLLVMTRRRQYLPPQPLDWFRALIAAFGDDIKIRVASKNGAAIAGILTLSHKEAMIYKYGCSNAAFNKFGGMALLLWRTVQEAKERGLEELDMGRSDVDNLGLIAFKEHWGATGSIIRYRRYPLKVTGPSRVWQEKMARQVVPRCPDVTLKMAGKLLYRHFG